MDRGICADDCLKLASASQANENVLADVILFDLSLLRSLVSVFVRSFVRLFVRVLSFVLSVLSFSSFSSFSCFVALCFREGAFKKT